MAMKKKVMKASKTKSPSTKKGASSKFVSKNNRKAGGSMKQMIGKKVKKGAY